MSAESQAVFEIRDLQDLLKNAAENSGLESHGSGTLVAETYKHLQQVKVQQQLESETDE